jgi:hypothetical protein
MTETRPAPDATDREVSRRRALQRLGLGAAAAYVAPSVVHLDRSANAQIAPTPCGPGKTKKGSPCPPI